MNHCFIQGRCYAPGDGKSIGSGWSAYESACEVCDPKKATDKFTLKDGYELTLEPYKCRESTWQETAIKLGWRATRTRCTAASSRPSRLRSSRRWRSSRTSCHLRPISITCPTTKSIICPMTIDAALAIKCGSQEIKIVRRRKRPRRQNGALLTKPTPLRSRRIHAACATHTSFYVKKVPGRKHSSTW